jgi:uncharacterized protein Smg (DUF494 family)
MVSKIVDVVKEIAERIQKDHSFEVALNSFSKEKKYDKKLVAAAYSWIHEKMISNILKQNAANKSEKAFRVLSEQELSTIGLENYNYLLHFYNLGLLTEMDINSIIEILNLFSFQTVNIDVLNLLILTQLTSIEKNNLPGSRFSLYHSDTIN